jgi:hypothetical protein
MNYRHGSVEPSGAFLGIAVLVIVVGLIFGVARLFSANNVAKNFGGTQVIELPANTKLVNATWKQDSLWYLTRPMVAGEKPTETIMHEQSALGILEGTIIFKEKSLQTEK